MQPDLRTVISGNNVTSIFVFYVYQTAIWRYDGQQLRTIVSRVQRQCAWLRANTTDNCVDSATSTLTRIAMYKKKFSLGAVGTTQNSIIIIILYVSAAKREAKPPEPAFIVAPKIYSQKVTSWPKTFSRLNTRLGLLPYKILTLDTPMILYSILRGNNYT